MTTTRHTTVAALALAATATLTVALSTPAAHAQRADTEYGYAAQRPTDPTDIGTVVAFRKAQQSQYLVDHNLLAFR